MRSLTLFTLPALPSICRNLPEAQTVRPSYAKYRTQSALIEDTMRLS